MAKTADASDLPYNVSGVSELLDPNTLLSPYLASRPVYHCPADNYIDTYAGNKVHVRSYSMNSAVGTTWSAFYLNGSPPLGAPVQGGWLDASKGYQGNQTAYLTYPKLTSFSKPGPASTWVMMDENPITINDGSFAVSAYAAPGKTYLIDYPTGLHGGSGGLAFADGHAVVHKWKDPLTYSPPLSLHGNGGQSPTPTPHDDVDCFYLAEITSALR